MGDESSAEPSAERPSSAAPAPAAPSAAEVTTAYNGPTKPEDGSAVGVPASEPHALVRHESLSFLQPGTQPGSLGRLGHFEVLEVLGKGGFGIVLKAIDDRLQRLVAIKVLSPHLSGSANARSRFVREARAAAAVNSKYVVGTYEVYEQPIPYLVMEYVVGESLQERLNRRGPLTTRDILRVGAEIARGLAAAHHQGLIHRDIKPANILLELHWQMAGGNSQVPSRDEQAGSGEPPTVSLPSLGRVKIADFGLARAVEDVGLTQSGMVAGTPLFMSPEQTRGEALDPRSDLFSLGSVLYAMCTGHPPFKASTTLGVMKRVRDDTPQPIHESSPATPNSLVDVIDRLLVKGPAGRFQTAGEVAERLEQLAQQEAGASGRSSAAEPPRKKARPRRPPRLWMAAACVLLGVFLAVALAESTGVTHWWQHRQPVPGPVEDGDRPEAAAPPTDFTNTLGMKFKLVPAGKFMMGSTKQESERLREVLGPGDVYVIVRLSAEVPEHPVEITRPFYVGTTEVTVRQFRQFIEESRYRGDADWKGDVAWKRVALKQTDDHPVCRVSWQNAVDFCNWLSAKEGKNYRLPTEAEWEYCCRAGKSGTRYCFGDDEAQLGNYAWYAGNSGGVTHPVGQKKPNEWGLYDMHGNVWEWCQDCFQYDYYKTSPVKDPPGGLGGERAIRGGSCADGPVPCRSAFRYSHPLADIGFRVLLVLPATDRLPS